MGNPSSEVQQFGGPLTIRQRSGNVLPMPQPAFEPPYSLETDSTSGLLIFEAGLTKYSGWSVYAEIDPRGHTPVIVALGVRTQGRDRGFQLEEGQLPAPPSATTSMLAGIRISDVVAACNLLGQVFLSSPIPDPATVRASSDEYYAAWAARYAAQVTEGSSSPIADLAADSDKSRSQIRDLIHACRRRGFLTEGHQGQPGGLLTDKARTVLEELQ